MKGEMTVKEIGRGVYVETRYEGGNVGAITTARGGLLVNAPMLPNEAREWQLALRQVGIHSLYGIVNTDYLPEHALGNYFFRPIRSFGHEAALRFIAKFEATALEELSVRYREVYPSLAQEILGMRFIPPEIAVGDRLTLYFEDRIAEILLLEGYTPGSLGLYLPQDRILFAGDNVTNGEHPALAQADSLAWLKTLERIEGMEIDLIVPGKGEPCGKDVIRPLYTYIEEMRNRVTELFQKGVSRRECVERVDLFDFFPVPPAQEALFRRRYRESIERVYTEVRVALRKRS